MEVSWEFFEMDPSWAMWWGFLLENSRLTPDWRSRWEGGWQMEMEGNSEFLQIFSVVPALGEVEGCLVGNSRCTPARICAPSLGWKF